MSLSAEAINTLESLERVAQDMLDENGSFVITEREVTGLRNAFKKTVTGATSPDSWPSLAKRCDEKLTELERLVANAPLAKSGDVDEDLPGVDPKRKTKYGFLRVPLQRRRQTLVVSLFLFFTGLPICTALTFALLWNSYTFPFMVAYLIYIFVRPPQHPIKAWKAWRGGFVNTNYRDYFPVRCVAKKEVREAIDPKRNYLFCYHPHGVHSFGAIVNFATDTTSTPKLFPGLKFHVQTLKINFYVPFWRELMIWGGSGDASAGCIKKTLSAGPGECVVLVVGGAEESMLASPKTNHLFLAKRKGFVKVALQSGAPLVPCFGFGENDVYRNLSDGRPWLQRLVKFCQKKFGFAPLLVMGRGYFNYHFGLIPHRRPLVTAVGMPVEVPKIENPTQADIDKYHSLYVEALLDLYKENKEVYDAMTKTGAQVR